MIGAPITKTSPNSVNSLADVGMKTVENARNALARESGAAQLGVVPKPEVRNPLTGNYSYSAPHRARKMQSLLAPQSFV